MRHELRDDRLPRRALGRRTKELRISAAELARGLDVPTNRITGILNGRRAMTGDTALRVAHFFGTAEFWLNLQSVYELRLAQQKAGESINDLPTLKRLKSDTKVGFATRSTRISSQHPVRKPQVAYIGALTPSLLKGRSRECRPRPQNRRNLTLYTGWQYSTMQPAVPPPHVEGPHGKQ
jgi:antitoxin HigA-1